MNISLSYYSGLGRRKNNEDSVSVLESPNGLLAIVADGLGGQDNGEYASRQAVKTLNDLLAHEPISSRKLTQAVLQANREIVSLQAGRPGAQTTIAAVWLGEGFAETAHVGDTRIYQFRDDAIIYQSTDHSLAQLGVMAGDLKLEDIRSNKDRNKLFRALGDRRTPKVAEKLLDILPREIAEPAASDNNTAIAIVING